MLTAKALIRLGKSESLLGAHVILLILSCGGSYHNTLPFFFSVKSETKPVPSKPPNQNPAGTPPVKSSVTASQVVNKSSTSVAKPGHTPSGSTTQVILGSTKSALLERISANTANNLNQNTLLAGHLTGAIPLKLNSGLVSTTQAKLPGTGPAILLAQSTQGTTQGQLPTTSPALLLTQSKPGTQPVVQQPVPETQTLYLTQRQQTYSPEDWTMIDVCHFLKYNDCSSHVETFHRNVSINKLVIPFRLYIRNLENQILQVNSFSKLTNSRFVNFWLHFSTSYN